MADSMIATMGKAERARELMRSVGMCRCWYCGGGLRLASENFLTMQNLVDHHQQRRECGAGGGHELCDPTAGIDLSVGAIWRLGRGGLQASMSPQFVCSGLRGIGLACCSAWSTAGDRVHALAAVYRHPRRVDGHARSGAAVGG